MTSHGATLFASESISSGDYKLFEEIDERLNAEMESFRGLAALLKSKWYHGYWFKRGDDIFIVEGDKLDNYITEDVKFEATAGSGKTTLASVDAFDLLALLEL